MREGHHHFEVGYVSVEGTAYFTTTGNAGDLLPATGAAERAAFIRWQRSAILMQEVDVLHTPIPIDVAGIVRLIIGAAFQERNGTQRTRRNEAARQEKEEQEQRGKQWVFQS